MKNFKEWIFIVLCILITLACIAFFIFYFKSIVTADIPWWMKMSLLKRK